MGTKRNLLDATLDAAMILKDAGVVTASGAAQVGAVNRVLNVGPAYLEGVMTVDWDALDVTSTDEGYEIRLQGSTDPTFATDVNIIASVRAGTAVGTGETVSGIGRRQVAFINNGKNGAPLPYLRAYHVLSGTTPSANYRAFIGQNPLHG